WGGLGEGVFLNTGGRYDPTTDTWTALSINGSSENAPAARFGHSAVWTGSEMIVWGGYNDLLLNTGGRYNPSTDSWGPSSVTTGEGTNVPAGRDRHTAIWTGS